MYKEILKRFCKVNSLVLKCNPCGEDMVEVCLKEKKKVNAVQTPDDQTIDDTGIVQIVDGEFRLTTACYAPNLEDACRWYVKNMLGKRLRIWRTGWSYYEINKLIYVPDSLEALQIELDLEE